MDKTSLFISYFTVILATITCLPLDSDTNCQTKFTNGTCIELINCPSALRLLKANDAKTLRDMSCGFNGRQPMVCCPLPGSPITFTINSSREVEQKKKRPTQIFTPLENNQEIEVTTAKPRPSSTTPFTPNTTNELEPTTKKSKPRSTTTYLDTTAQMTKELELTTENFIPSTSISNFTPVESIIAMPDSAVKPALPLDPFPNRNICGKSMSSDKIFGGILADIEEYPWLARIKYKFRNGKEAFACSASLITNQYLITAAHCVTSLNPLSVRLGEWDEEAVIDCQEKRCIDRPRDIEIVKTIVHPGFNQKENNGDIALILLEEPVKFTEFISPICLPTTDYMKMQDYVRDTSYWTAGWGVTEFGETSAIKRKVNLEAVTSDICQGIYPKIPSSSFSQIICAGGRQGKDTCKGDSGGPLMRTVKEDGIENWYLFGITSSGFAKCGAEGYPGLYTRVTKYMDWIRKTIST